MIGRKNTEINQWKRKIVHCLYTLAYPFFKSFFTLFYFTILYWFCHTLTWIHHGCTFAPKHGSPSHLFPHNISLGHPRAPAPSMLCPASFNQKVSNLGRRWTCAPWKTSLKILLHHRSFKGKRGMISVNHWGGGQGHHCPPLPSALSTSCGLSLVAILFTQFIFEITKGEAGEEV